VLCVATLFATATLASADTPTLGGGDCWRSGTPMTCRTSWQGPETYMYFKTIDHFSWAAPIWSGGIGQAMWNWNVAPGPQINSWNDLPNNSWNYMEYSWTGHGGNEWNTWAMTWICNSSGWCTNTNTAMNIHWASIYLNRDLIDPNPPNMFISTVAHELGHAYGLFHNPSPSSLMYPSNLGIQSPNGDDYGATPPCSGSPAGGTRCVYYFTN
jgi:hypothetical protein